MTHRFTHCQWRLWWPWHSEVVFLDGKVVHAAPGYHDDLEREMASQHGFGKNLVGLWLSHDLSHCILAEWLGWPFSPTLRTVVEPGYASPEFRQAEEVLVLGFQAWLNGGPRPTIDPMLWPAGNPRETSPNMLS